MLKAAAIHEWICPVIENYKTAKECSVSLFKKYTPKLAMIDLKVK